MRYYFSYHLNKTLLETTAFSLVVDIANPLTAHSSKYVYTALCVLSGKSHCLDSFYCIFK